MIITNQKYWHDGQPVASDLRSHIIESRGQSLIIGDSVWPTDLSDPFKMRDMNKAVKTIWEAIGAGTKIGIVGDYDMDGTPAAVLLSQFLARINHPYEVILPTRQQGYGFSVQFVDQFVTSGVGLIVTVDCGITSLDAVEYAQSKGVAVVITDHHQLPQKLPPAVAIVNPSRDTVSSPTASLCGTGVAFKLLQALQLKCPSRFAPKITPEWLAWQLDLVALATLADMVSLRGENVHLVRLGLKVLQRGRRVGLLRLMTSLGLDSAKISYRDCVYKIIPRFNASGRIDNMDAVFKLLSQTDEALLEQMIEAIKIKYIQSRIMADEMFEKAVKKAQDLPQTDSILMVYDPSWHPGVTGLVAGRLASQFRKPSLVLANGGQAIFRGSGRSYGSFNLFDALKPLADSLIAFGGHAQAVGLSVTQSQMPLFIKSVGLLDLDNCADTMIKSDGILNAGSVSVDDIEQLERLAPWGVGNPEPTWSVVGASVSTNQWLGEGKHLKLVLTELPQLEVMVFDAQKYHLPENGLRLDLLGSLGINEFNGRRSPQFIVKGIALHKKKGSHG